MTNECEHPPYATDTRRADEAEARQFVGDAKHDHVELTFCGVCGEVFSAVGVGDGPGA